MTKNRSIASGLTESLETGLDARFSSTASYSLNSEHSEHSENSQHLQHSEHSDSSHTNSRIRNRRLWTLAREVVRDRGGIISLAEAEVIARERFPDGHESDDYEEAADRLVAFIVDVKYAAGDGPFERAVALARAEPPPAWAAGYESRPRLHFLCCLIAKLPPGTKGKDLKLVVLSQYRIAAVMGIEQPWVSRLISRLCRDGVLRLVRKAVTNKRCARYRYTPPKAGASKS